MGPSKLVGKFGSPGWTRTSDIWINSPPFYQLNYRGIENFVVKNLSKFYINHSVEYTTSARLILVLPFEAITGQKTTNTRDTGNTGNRFRYSRTRTIDCSELQSDSISRTHDKRLLSNVPRRGCTGD